MLRSPHSPPPSAACDSLALVCSSIEPPPQAERASVATAATAPSRAARLRAVLMVVLLIWWWIGTSLGSPVSRASGLDDLPVAGEADGQSRVERPPRPGPVVTTYVGSSPGDPVEHHAEQHDGDARGKALAPRLAAREAVDDVVAERAGADEAADHGHGQHVEQALVGGEDE